MTDTVQDKVVAFDTLFTTNHIQMLKVLLSYMEPSRQKTIAVYIKFMELQYTISFFNRHPSSALPNFRREETFNASKLCDELLPLCGRAEQEQLKQMKNMCQSFENMQEMMQMMEMMKSLFPEGDNPFGGDPSALLSGMGGGGGMDMSQLFEMLQGMSS